MTNGVDADGTLLQIWTCFSDNTSLFVMSVGFADCCTDQMWLPEEYITWSGKNMVRCMAIVQYRRRGIDGLFAYGANGNLTDGNQLWLVAHMTPLTYRIPDSNLGMHDGPLQSAVGPGGYHPTSYVRPFFAFREFFCLP